jgi:hypothetical protein
VGVAGYDIYRNSSFIASTTNLFYADTGLAASSQYAYAVAAFDAAGNVSGESSSTSATTQSASSGGGGGGSVAVASAYANPNPTSTLTLPSSSSSVQPSAAAAQTLLASLTAELNSLLKQATNEGIPIPSTGIVSFTFTRDLQLHDVGTDVKALQEFLNSKGFLVSKMGSGSLGHETTYFGSKTFYALTEFQKSVGIHATGYFGSITRAYVNKLMQ